jgi:hypothetical protein
MAVIVMQNQTRRASEAELAGLLRNLEAMTEEDAQRLVDKINLPGSKS